MAINLDYMQQGVTWNKRVPFSFIDMPCCCRSFEEAHSSQLNNTTLRQYLQQGLTLAFGKIGGAIPFEVLSLQQGSAVAFLKADKRYMCACTVKLEDSRGHRPERLSHRPVCSLTLISLQGPHKAQGSVHTD